MHWTEEYHVREAVNSRTSLKAYDAVMVSHNAKYVDPASRQVIDNALGFVVSIKLQDTFESATNYLYFPNVEDMGGIYGEA